jgi:predicted nucleic acid-binding Zn finger protein
MSRKLVNREVGRLIAQTNGAITTINESNYKVKSKSSDNTYTVTATHSGWTCSCPDYARHNAKCKHVYSVEYFRSQRATP